MAEPVDAARRRAKNGETGQRPATGRPPGDFERRAREKDGGYRDILNGRPALTAQRKAAEELAMRRPAAARMRSRVAINDDGGLEREADLMGSKAAAAEPRRSLPAEALPTPDLQAIQYKPAPVAQLGKDKQKRRKKAQAAKPKKSRNSESGEAPEQRLKAETEWQPEGDEALHVIAQEGGEKTAYEEENETPKLFWRGDTRGPDEVFATGFTTTNERDGKVPKGANRIIWRGGGGFDDIMLGTAVYMAKDIRGGAFFPLSGESEFYLYAAGKTQAVNTFKAQKHKEAALTGRSDYQRDERYQYDPAFKDDESASAVWQFQEYAAHRIETTEIAAAFKVARRTLIPPGQDPLAAIAGVQFRLEFVSIGPIGGIKSKALRAQMGALAKEARSVAAGYQDWYPDEKSFLSYMGIVKPRSPGRLPATREEAPARMQQVKPVVVQERSASNRPGRGPADRTPDGPGSNRTGLPDRLKAGVESLSGLAMDDVRVHRNSSAPAALGALAFAQGSDIHLAPGQEKHLPHEAWHVVQQKQRRVKPTLQMKNVAINGDAALEREADLMGATALRTAGSDRALLSPPDTGRAAVVQRVIYANVEALLAAVWPGGAGPVPDVTTFSVDLQALFADAASQLPLTDVLHTPGLGRIAEAGINPAAPPPYLCEYDPAMGTPEFLVASILHELLHVSTQENYRKNGIVSDFLNMNLPPGLAIPAGVANEINAQMQILDNNLIDAVAVVTADGALPALVQAHVLNRLNNYARPMPSVHYDTVLADILAFMELHGVNSGPAFTFITRLVRESTDRRLVNPWWGTKTARRVDRNTPAWHFWKW